MLSFLSDFIIPLIVLFVIANGLLHKIPIYDEFVKGAIDGIKVVYEILPTLIGLMIAIGVLRASGALDGISAAIAPFVEKLHFPSELVPLTTVKMFSSSAATSLLLDIYKQYGPDSYLGRLASILMSCSETIFYTVSVYFLATAAAGKKGVRYIRYTIWGSLFATLAGIIASVILAGMF